MRLTEARQGVRMLKFMDVFGRSDAAELNQLEASELLGVGERTFRRWCRRYEEDGEAGLLDRRIGKASGTPSIWCVSTGSPGATAGRRLSCKAGICCRRRSIAGRTVASGHVVRCPG